MNDRKTAVLIQKQIPEFILEDSPRFLSFMEAYYEFLDNTVSGVSKDLRYIADIDDNLDIFEQQFFNTFLKYLPRNTAINKEFIIKNIMPLYLSKGSEKSFKYLFRLLFNEEATISYPGQNILRASDGRWVYENILRIDNNISSSYISDGIQTTYYLPDQYNISQFNVLINNIPVNDFILLKEYKKIIFNTPPPLGFTIQIKYLEFNISLLNDRKIIGDMSKAVAVIETAGIRRSIGYDYFEFLIDISTLIGSFVNGEMVSSDIILGNVNIPLNLQTFSDLDTITILNGGSSYNIGDPVIIRGVSSKPAIAIVDNIASGDIDNLSIKDGGCGFKINSRISANGYSNTSFNCYINTIDTLGKYSSNSIYFNTDIIGDFVNVTINSADYGMAANGVENLSTILSVALESNTINNLGGITSIVVNTSTISSQFTPSFIIEPITIPESGAGINYIYDLGTIGKIKIINGGINYQTGDPLVFKNNLSYNGQGVEASVSSVDTFGGITSVYISNGGFAYSPGLFPDITVSSSNGSNAVLVVDSIMGEGDILVPVLANTVAGQILSIKIIDPGVGYVSIPGIDLSGYGDGTANANCSIKGSYFKQGGRWTTSDGLLSNEDIVLEGRDYFIDFSYLITAKVEFFKYKNIIKNLLHPAGLINYAKYSIEDSIESLPQINVSSSKIKTVSGTINIANGSIIVIGTNTKFNVANTLGIMTVGSNVAINNDIRTVSSIQSNTQFTVNISFDITSNNEFIKII